MAALDRFHCSSDTGCFSRSTIIGFPCLEGTFSRRMNNPSLPRRFHCIMYKQVSIVCLDSA